MPICVGLLFLVGVIFFLYRLKDIVLYVSLFTLGHSLTLLAGVLGNIPANAYLIDAVIGLSVSSPEAANGIGFTLIFGLMRNVNLAHGSLYLLGGYVGYAVAEKTGWWILALAADQQAGQPEVERLGADDLREALAGGAHRDTCPVGGFRGRDARGAVTDAGAPDGAKVVVRQDQGFGGGRRRDPGRAGQGERGHARAG